MEVLGLIPARGGSKGIPHKNIALLAGRPLLAYTCDAALGSRWLTRVVLSTDDPAIAGVGRDNGVEVPFLRPPDLARDETPMIDVVAHLLTALHETEGYQPEIVALLQPTSPLRRAAHIDEALDLMQQMEADTVVSVVQVPHHFSPYKVMRLEGGWLHDFWPDSLPFDRSQRQAVPTLYARNGPAVLATRAGVVRDQHRFYGPRIAPYVMTERDSVDVDTPHDLELAAWLLARRDQATMGDGTRR